MSHEMHQAMILVGDQGLVQTSCPCGWMGDPVYAPETGVQDYLAHLNAGRCHACGQVVKPEGDAS